MHGLVFQNQGAGVEIAHLPGRAFADVTAADVAAAPFTTRLIDQPSDDTRVILIRPDQGAVYLLGNPVEDDAGVTFDTQLLSSK